MRASLWWRSTIHRETCVTRQRNRDCDHPDRDVAGGIESGADENRRDRQQRCVLEVGSNRNRRCKAAKHQHRRQVLNQRLRRVPPIRQDHLVQRHPIRDHLPNQRVADRMRHSGPQTHSERIDKRRCAASERDDCHSPRRRHAPLVTQPSLDEHHCRRDTQRAEPDDVTAMKVRPQGENRDQRPQERAPSIDFDRERHHHDRDHHEREQLRPKLHLGRNRHRAENQRQPLHARRRASRGNPDRQRDYQNARTDQLQQLEPEHPEMRIKKSQRHLRQPFVIVPRRAQGAVRVSVEPRYMTGAQRRLPGQHVNPQIRLGEVVSRRQRDRQDYCPSRRR